MVENKMKKIDEKEKEDISLLKNNIQSIFKAKVKEDIKKADEKEKEKKD